MESHMSCYGKMFPSTAIRQPGKERPAAVFGFLPQQPGTVTLPPDITVDIDAWDRCVQCRDFSTCQQLSTAKVMLEMAVRN